MTQDEIIEMARQAGGEFYVTSGNQTPTWYFSHSTIYDFAKLVAAKALAQEQEPVAWRTFDGEGGYDYCSYEDNESYADDWNKRNPNHKGWVDKLYTHSQRTWVGLTDVEIDYLLGSTAGENEETHISFARAIESKIKELNT